MEHDNQSLHLLRQVDFINSPKAMTGSVAGVALLEQFRQITLSGMEQVRLMNRMDTKYLLPVFLLPEIWSALTEEYDVLENAGTKVAAYETIYYDTPGNLFFRNHINGKLNRVKVRTRRYVESDLLFLEVKKKTNKGRTKKFRQLIDTASGEFPGEALQLVETFAATDFHALQEVLHNRFDRVTLVNREMTERVTIDMNLRYSLPGGEEQITIPWLSVIEVKQERSSHSPMTELLRRKRIRAMGFSKYCLGISRLLPREKSNRYKRIIRTIEKITQHGLTC